MLTRELFLSLAGKIEEVELPSGKVLIREMSAGDYRKFVDASDKRDDQYGRLLVASICDENGKLLYGPADVEAINALPMGVVRPVWNAALKLNKLMADEAETEAEEGK